MHAKAIKEPISIPKVIVVPMKAPTCPRSSTETVPGAFTAQRVDAYPLVKANKQVFEMQNQSEQNNQSGLT